jgi:hypothetical protein
VSVTRGDSVAVVVLKAAVGTQAASQRIDRQIKNTPVAITKKESLLARDVVIDSRHDLIVISSGSRRGCEIVVDTACVVGAWPEIQKLYGCSVNPVGRKNIICEWRRGGSATGTRALGVYDPSARVVDLVDHHRPTAGVHASIVADARGKTGFADFRKIANSFLHVGNSSSERFASPQPEAFSAQKPKRLVSTSKARNAQRPAGIGSELVLYPRGPGPTDRIQKEIVRVEDLVTEIFVRFSVQRTCTRLRAEIGDAWKTYPIRVPDYWFEP